MTQEEKAKAYDEAIEKLRSLRDDYDTVGTLIDIKKELENIFPELIESEDERIKKSLTAFFAKFKPDDMWDADFSFGDILAWFEKLSGNNLIMAKSPQLGEHKPADKIEPKFYKGEWITNGDYTWKIVEVKPLDYILQSQDGNIVDDTISHVDEQFHSFSIEDAKDGDVLYSPCCKLLWVYKDENTCYVGSNLNYNSGSIVTNKPVCIPTDVQPATKEQRDALMKAMADAGYTFDFEKKELKKAEQTSANETPYPETLEKAIDLYYNSYGNGEGEFEHLSLEKFRDIVHTFVSDYGQKPAWSEEELDSITAAINNLEYLKNNYVYHQMGLEPAIIFIKSLKDRYTWKPSDEQIKALHDINLTGNISYSGQGQTLIELYNNLKKLKGE